MRKYEVYQEKAKPVYTPNIVLRVSALGKKKRVFEILPKQNLGFLDVSIASLLNGFSIRRSAGSFVRWHAVRLKLLPKSQRKFCENEVMMLIMQY